MQNKSMRKILCNFTTEKTEVKPSLFHSTVIIFHFRPISPTHLLKSGHGVNFHISREKSIRAAGTGPVCIILECGIYVIHPSEADGVILRGERIGWVKKFFFVLRSLQVFMWL